MAFAPALWLLVVSDHGRDLECGGELVVVVRWDD